MFNSIQQKIEEKNQKEMAAALEARKQRIEDLANEFIQIAKTKEYSLQDLEIACKRVGVKLEEAFYSKSIAEVL